jgi:hypothetical protein
VNKAVDWERVQLLAGDLEVSQTQLALNEEKEFWFDVAPGHREMGVWRDGSLVPEAWPQVQGRPPVARREFVWNPDREIFVDIEVRGERATVRRGYLNSLVLHCSSLPEGEVDSLLEDYRQWGFLPGSPWHTDVREVVRRTYRGDTIVTVWLDATNVVVHEPKTSALEVVECDTREEAIELIETRIDALESQRGCMLARVEVLPAAFDNPPVVALCDGGSQTQGAAGEPSVLDDLPPPPEDAKEAVDAAIDLLQVLCNRYPSGHLVVEMEWDGSPRIQTLEEGESFVPIHADRFSQWQARRMTCDRLALAELTSSYDYFAQRYGSISWILTRNLKVSVPVFPFDNVYGSGVSPLQIDAKGTYCVEPELLPEPLRYFHVFGGGWQIGCGFALDKRWPDALGECPIVAYDESEPPLGGMQPELVTRFGHWLLAHVTALIAEIEPALRRIQ